MRILKQDSKAEQAIQEAEKFLHERNISIHNNGMYTIIELNNKSYRLVDTENLDDCPSVFPREFDSERLELI